jgi:hypothetical protein
MRVQIVDEIASLKARLGSNSGKAFENVGENLPLAEFRAALTGRDSFFHLQDCVVEFPERSSRSHGACVGEFVIAFRRLDLIGNRSLYSRLSQTLQGLLKATSSSDALFAKLCVLPPSTEESRPSEFSLIVQLEAIGSTPEQAELRWGFGLGHIREAIISASALLREQLAKPDARSSPDT